MSCKIFHLPGATLLHISRADALHMALTQIEKTAFKKGYLSEARRDAPPGRPYEYKDG